MGKKTKKNKKKMKGKEKKIVDINEFYKSELDKLLDQAKNNANNNSSKYAKENESLLSENKKLKEENSELIAQLNDQSGSSEEFNALLKVNETYKKNIITLRKEILQLTEKINELTEKNNTDEN